MHLVTFAGTLVLQIMSVLLFCMVILDFWTSRQLLNYM